MTCAYCGKPIPLTTWPWQLMPHGQLSVPDHVALRFCRTRCLALWGIAEALAGDHLTPDELAELGRISLDA